MRNDESRPKAADVDHAADEINTRLAAASDSHGSLAHAAGMSGRAIATAIGCSASTVGREVNSAGRGRPVILGLDGKIYPNYSRQERLLLIAECHRLRHCDGLSIRQVRRSLADRGVVVSVGAISGYLSRWICSPACSRGPSAAPEQLVQGGDHRG